MFFCKLCCKNHLKIQHMHWQQCCQCMCKIWCWYEKSNSKYNKSFLIKVVFYEVNCSWTRPQYSGRLTDTLNEVNSQQCLFYNHSRADRHRPFAAVKKWQTAHCRQFINYGFNKISNLSADDVEAINVEWASLLLMGLHRGCASVIVWIRKGAPILVRQFGFLSWQLTRSDRLLDAVPYFKWALCIHD